MMNEREISECKLITERLNDIFAITYYISIRFDEKKEEVSVFRVTDVNQEYPLKTINVIDDNPKGFLLDVLEGVSEY
ncbi:hypothetical protein SAMN02745213_01765 [Succinivibrio dextrinosolvens DSM 3072]|uniref:Uncharacterized protein n=1 Tax=Succinivibrio dextrinosolvens DSM 3072 TaxID=1123324 RepID=A0A1T4VML2_9GAMM|nr:hypothetical protein [Succinivibrio dextrinosolvens]SKA66176.1 hypothetical protein SAMN02745213_01765 [Succinivibrio dextrinosolvens DSM 3072]